jgi:hypothetical protein
VVTVDLRTAAVLLLTAAVLGSGEEQARESKSRQVNVGGRNGERERASAEATRFSSLGRARAWTEAWRHERHAEATPCPGRPRQLPQASSKMPENQLKPSCSGLAIS